MNYYNPFSSMFLSVPATGYALVGINGESGWNTYAVYSSEIIDWIENSHKDSYKPSSINFVYDLSPELEMLFTLRWK